MKVEKYNVIRYECTSCGCTHSTLDSAEQCCITVIEFTQPQYCCAICGRSYWTKAAAEACYDFDNPYDGGVS